VWPGLGGKPWLQTPKWFLKRFGDKLNSNVGIDFSKSARDASGSKSKGKKRIPKGKARKLGE